MSNDLPVVGRLRDPEHTGENRCWPCTVVNAALAGLLAAAAALVAVELAVLVAVGSLAAIALRGYLVPGTPTLTKRYLPDRVLRAFGKAEPTEADDFEVLERVDYHREHAVDEERYLRDAGVATGTGTDDSLTDGFADALAEATDTLPADLAPVVADLFDREPADVAVSLDDPPEVTVGVRTREWPAAAALRSDLAAHRALADWTDDWRDVPVEQRVDMLKQLRLLRRTCPACGGTVERGSERVVSCCGVHEVFAVACTACGERLAERKPHDEMGKLAS